MIFLTVCSADEFQNFIPPFAYTALRAYPDATVKIFIRGRLDEDNKRLLPLIKGDLDIEEDSFLNYKYGESFCNTMRYLVPEKTFDGHDLAYVTDVDFLIFRQDPSHWNYHKEMMRKSRTCCSAFRSAVRGPKRPEVTKIGWVGKYTRMVCGTTMLDLPTWLPSTRQYRKQYKAIVKAQVGDKKDSVPACTYREYDEVMLARICKRAGLPIPQATNHFAHGEKFDMKYRDIHLGDFKFDKRWTSIKKMRRMLTDGNVKFFTRMHRDDETWNKIYEVCVRKKLVGRCLKNLRTHAKARL